MTRDERNERDRDDRVDFLRDHRTIDNNDDRFTGISVTVVTTVIIGTGPGAGRASEAVVCCE